MKSKRAAFIIFIILQGMLYLFLIPPWQSPDEPHHFGYGALLSKNEEIGSEAHQIIDGEIVQSMADFYAFHYQNLPCPEPLPRSLSELSFYYDIESLSEREPLYYRINSFVLKAFSPEKTIDQFYITRLLSFLYFMITVYFLYLASKLIFKDNILYVYATVCLVASLPQFLIISTSVNPVNLAVMLGAVFLYIILYSLDKEKHLIALASGPLIMGLAFFVHRVALFMVPPYLVLLLVYFVRSLKNRKELMKFSVSILVIVLISMVLFFVVQHIFPEYFEKVVLLSGVKPRIDDMNEFVRYISLGTSQSLSNFLNGTFKTFWFFAGWLRFEYHVDIYSVLKLICLLSVFGLLKYLYSYSSQKQKRDVNVPTLLVLVATGLPIIFGAVIRYYPSAIVAQGRYVFPAVCALALLFVLGLKEIFPRKQERWVPLFIIVGLIALNLYTLFHSLIDVFYYFTNA